MPRAGWSGGHHWPEGAGLQRSWPPWSSSGAPARRCCPQPPERPCPRGLVLDRSDRASVAARVTKEGVCRPARPSGTRRTAYALGGGARLRERASGDALLRRSLLRLARVLLDDVAEDVVDLRHELGLELHAGGLDVLGDLLGTRGADQRGCDVRVLQHPGDGELGHRQAGLVGDRLEVLHSGQHVVVHEPLDHVGAALLVGGTRALRRLLAGLVLARQDALRDGAPHDLADAELLAGRHDLALDDAPQHGVLRLARDELEAELLGEPDALADLLGGPLADADVERLALADDVGKRLHRLLERGLGVVAVGLVEVDVVGLQALQRAVDRLHDVLAGQARVVLAARTGGPVDLGEDLQRLPPLALERVAEDRLGLGVGVDVGGVERGDAAVERGPHALHRRLVLDLRAVGEPVAVGDLGDLESAVAEVSEFHVSTVCRAQGRCEPGPSAPARSVLGRPLGRPRAWADTPCGGRRAAGAAVNTRLRASCPVARSVSMIILGIVLILLGLLVASLKVLLWIGVILLIVGLVVNLVPIGGTKRRWY